MAKDNSVECIIEAHPKQMMLILNESACLYDDDNVHQDPKNFVSQTSPQVLIPEALNPKL